VKRTLVLFILLCPTLILLFPARVQEITQFESVAPEPRPLQSFYNYEQALESIGQSFDKQGILIETLSGQRLAAHNSEIAFNPASVMKLATSLVALSKFGPDYRYRTSFLADGPIDQRAHSLYGDLVVEGSADPMFSQTDAQQVATELLRMGISRVSGALRIAGPFYYFANGYHSMLSPETSAEKLRRALLRAGVKINGKAIFGSSSGTLLVSHYSDQLLRILLYQNAYSSNAIAEAIGESLGGPRAIEDYLIRNFGLSEAEIYVGRASGLDINRITPQASLKVLRALIAVLRKYSLVPEDVMPVAGVDSGTLYTRLNNDKVRGSVVAKTGTLLSVDNGVSTLVGLAYTRARGPVLFAIFNSGGSVFGHRRLQDKFIEELIEEEGGPAQMARAADALADYPHAPIVQAFNQDQIQPSRRPSN
jgi:D-alanyl-D-alanine carboxypeptidase/D-alanyl-D-alanine-endopeptidase (penicillin-binding protein 4)